MTIPSIPVCSVEHASGVQEFASGKYVSQFSTLAEAAEAKQHSTEMIVWSEGGGRGESPSTVVVVLMLKLYLRPTTVHRKCLEIW